MKDYRDLIGRLRSESNCNVLDDVGEAADAIEELMAELHRAEVIISEQARANQVLRKIIQNEG